MPADDILDRVSVASPCSASWADMKGDDRVRLCGLCDKHVYNLSAMPAAEASAFVARSEGRICIQFFRRKDGTILTSDCPVGLATRARRRLFRLASFAVIGAAAAITGASRVSARLGESAVSAQAFPFREWFEWTLLKLGLMSPPPPPVTRGQMVMGRIAIAPAAPAVCPAPTTDAP